MKSLHNGIGGECFDVELVEAVYEPKLLRKCPDENFTLVDLRRLDGFDNPCRPAACGKRARIRGEG
jgi:hypothetical protein